LSDKPTRRPLTPHQIRALAHPLRYRLLELLREGPATATTLARRLGESSGATSYHLRQLGRYGLVEEDSERGTGRERWWRRREQMLLMDMAVEDAEHIAAYTSLRATILERDDEAVSALTVHEERLGTRRDGLWMGNWRVRATADEIEALVQVVAEAVDALRRPADETPAGGTVFHLTFRSIPLA
jgi:DNA-binding transcriptional ArsR family regulator